MPFDIGARIEPISGGKRINSLSMRLNEAQHGVMPLIGNEGRGKLQIAEPIRRPHRNPAARPQDALQLPRDGARSEEHTSELQSLMRISYAVFCLKKKKQTPRT